jgi:hypothetical protein
MATIPVQSTNPIQDLASRITKKLDVDGDGNLSSIEFSSFLTQFLGALQTQPQNGSATSALNQVLNGNATASADRKAVGTMAGFDPIKMANASHDSTKYRIGRILQYYPNTPAGLRDALPEIQQIIPGVKIAGSNGDKLDFGSYVDPKGYKIGIIDVLQAAGAGGTAWQWAPVS